MKTNAPLRSDSDKRNLSRQGKKIVWISSLVLDRSLHKTSRIQILEHLAKRGHEVYLIAMHSRKKPSRDEGLVNIMSMPIRYVSVLSPVMYIIALFLFLPIFILEKKPDFIVTEPEEQFFALIPSAIVLPAKKFKHILDIRSTPVSSLRNQGTLGYLKTFNFRLCLQLAKRLFSGITIITSLMKEEVCEQFNIDPKKVGVWVDGVSKSLFSPEKYGSDRVKLRSKFGLSDKFVVFYHGTCDKNRGLAEAVESLQLLKSEHSDVVLFMLGAGPFRQHLLELVKRNQLQSNVMFHEPVDYKDVPRYITISDVGIVPLPNRHYWRNQCPLNLIEYLAMKKTVLLTDIPANREIVGNEDCGIYLSCTPASIAASISYAYNNRVKLDTWGASGRRIVENKYNYEKASIALEKYLLSLE